MGLESATYISQLVSTNPAAGDNISQGDDHLRLLKAVLRAQFPSLGAAAVSLSAAQLNATDYAIASATGTLTGCATAPTCTISFSRIGPLVIAIIPAIVAVSASTACTITLTPPAGFWPTAQLWLPAAVESNSVVVPSVIGVGTASNAFVLAGAISTVNFVNSGSKGLPYNTVLAYPANI